MSSWSRRIASRLELFQMLHGPGDALLAGRIALVAAAVPVLMRLPLGVASRLCTRRPPFPPLPPEEQRLAQLLALIPAVLHAGRPLLRAHCLPRGLTHYYFLRRAGLEVELCFGMGAKEGGYAGHCWLVLGGVPYLEPRDPSLWYAEFYRFPTGPVTAADGATRRRAVEAPHAG